jgi:RHS repeat-associated protein
MNLKGRLAAVFDRASLTYMTYDARGRVTRTDRAIAHPDILLTNLDDRYQAPWFSKDHTYDSLDRIIEETTGAASAELLDASQRSATSVMYSARGSVHRVLSTYGNLVNAIDRSADGLIETMVYADAATTIASQGYDARRRLVTAMVSRGEPALWADPPSSYQPARSLQGPPSFQHTLRDESYEYDVVNNPIAINDFRDADDWPAGAKPVSRAIGYDNLYRVTSVNYAYGTTADTWVSPFDPELSGMDDPRRPDDFPSHLTPATRPTEQTYEYDWLGSLTSSSDDQNAFWDRGMGPMRNDDANGRPYRWQDAGDSADPTWDGTGWADTGNTPADYDAAGNLRQIRVVRSGACTNGTNDCNLRFYYYFDEVGRLYRGMRYEGATLKADLSFVYDSSDNRVIKSDNTLSGITNDAHTLYVFDSLELRRTAHDATTETYSRTVENEVPYLIANGVRVARVVYEGAADGEPRLDGTSRLHVFINIADHLGSTSTVIDRDTGELVERTTYQPYGATESDYRPARWKGFREDYRFTGKEEDQEIGLTYFGKRYLSPYLGRWLTPDPLAVHMPGQADLNLYAYVRGAALRAVDPIGLDWFEGWGAKIDSLAQKAADTIDKSTLARGISKGVDSTINHVSARVDQFVKAVKSPEVQAVASVSPAAAPMAAAVKVAWNDAKTVVQNPKEALKTVLVENPISQTALALKAAVQGDGEALGEHAVKGTIGALSLAAGDKLLSGPKGCFVAGTLVWTERGLVPIESLLPGDWVLAMPDDGSGGLSFRQVLETYEREPSAIFDLTLFDDKNHADTLGVTPEHPFWGSKQEWVLAEDLRPGDVIWSIERGWLTVKSIHVRPQQEPVYNLNVDIDHTYVVGVLGTWAHNSGPCSKSPAPTGNNHSVGTIETAEGTRASNTTRLGVKRNNPADWRHLRDLWDDLGYGDILSDANRAAIAKGQTPVVDDAWIKHFPGDAALTGEKIPMHHIGGSPITVPLPASRHLDAHMPGGFRKNPGGPGTSG